MFKKHGVFGLLFLKSDRTRHWPILEHFFQSLKKSWNIFQWPRHFFSGPDIFSVAQTFFQWPRHFFSGPDIFSVAQCRHLVSASARSCAQLCGSCAQLRPSCDPAAAHLSPAEPQLPRIWTPAAPPIVPQFLVQLQSLPPRALDFLEFVREFMEFIG